MFLYLLSYISCFVLGISKQRYNKVISFTLLVFLAVFLCFGYFCGSDWRNYELWYYRVDLERLFYNYFAEPGYYIYMLVFRFFDIDFWHFTIFTKLWCFVSFYSMLYYYLKERVWLGLMYFVPWYGFFLFIDCPFRNLIAVAIFLIAIHFFIQRKVILSLLLILIASTFHVSTIIFLPCIFFVGKKVPTKIWVLLYILFNIFLGSRELLTNVLSSLFGNLPYVSAKIQGYLLDESEAAAGGSLFSLGMLIQLVFFILLIWKRQVIERHKNGIFIFNFAMIYQLFYRIALTIELFSRFQLFTSVFFCIALIMLMHAFKPSSQKLYLVYLLCIASVGTTKLFADNRYIPYTSYIPYMFQTEQPSYEYRSQYNYMHSPYNK